MSRWLLFVAVVIVTWPADVGAQGGRGRGGRMSEAEPNAIYDGRFTFVRVRYEDGFGANGPIMISQQIPWSHDYPRGERHFMKILSELSTVRARTTESVILTLNDPELFKYPVAYMSEPGYWRPNDAEIAGMRAYLQKGGFFIFDDFQGQHWYNFEAQMRRVLPDGKLVRLTVDHPIFDSFYKIESLEAMEEPYDQPLEFWGVFEDNDPKKRLILIANYNNDLSEFWEFSDQGFFPISVTNESFKLGVNYIVYALTR